MQRRFFCPFREKKPLCFGSHIGALRRGTFAEFLLPCRAHSRRSGERGGARSAAVALCAQVEPSDYQPRFILTTSRATTLKTVRCLCPLSVPSARFRWRSGLEPWYPRV